MKDSFKMNDLIRKMRIAKGLTQKQVAELIHISPKTVSNWERKITRVDGEAVSDFIRALNIDKDLFFSMLETRNFLQEVQFYICPVCNNVTWSYGGRRLTCCGRPLTPLTVHKCNEEHNLYVEYSRENQNYTITTRHPMEKEHYIKFIAYALPDSVTIINTTPSHDLEATLPPLHRGKLYFYCTKHGLFENLEQ